MPIRLVAPRTIARLFVAVFVSGTLALIAGCFRRPAVNVACEQVTGPGAADHTFLMRFRVTNRGGVTASAIEVEIRDTDLSNEPIEERSSYTLRGPFPADVTLEREEEVPAPPPFRMAKFSSYGCTLSRILFADGTTWR